MNRTSRSPPFLAALHARHRSKFGAGGVRPSRVDWSGKYTPRRCDNRGAVIERRWIVLASALLLPMVGLGLLVLRPELDLVWEHHPSHFWLVLAAAAMSVVLAYLTNETAARHADARIFLVSLAFLLSAGFLGLHALATPGVLLASPNAGFVIATPVGLIVASAFSAAWVSPLAGPRSSREPSGRQAGAASPPSATRPTWPPA
jgi:hypothetical protein